MPENWNNCFAENIRREFSGKGVVIAGVNEGNIGAMLSDAFHALGARVVMIGHEEKPLQELAASLTQRPAQSTQPSYAPIVITADLLDTGERLAATAKAIEATGAPAAFISTLGQDKRIPLGEIDEGQLNSLTKINFQVPVLMARDMILEMRKVGGGVVSLFTSHHGGLLHDTDMLGYAPAKAAIDKSIKLLAQWAGATNTPDNIIRVIGIRPGWIQTPAQKERFPDAFTEATKSQLIPLEMKPRDMVIPGITYLSRTVGGLSSGVIYDIDCGRSENEVRKETFPS
ncbi:MAG: 3-oxoacyl-ACP reductase [Micavibrio sp.]|nr:3-oxoacyl-ACP reductase [Micavibrio sp.]